MNFKVIALSKMICVSGNLASGKSTLARGLAAELGWTAFPRRGVDETYLSDLFTNPTRWSFEAQMAFLSNKAQSILDAMSKGIDIVLDRSIYEDVEVFARLFASTGWMDARAYSTYSTYAQILLERLPVPIAVVYCDAPPEVCEQRLRDRPRPYQKLYPPDHLYTLEQLLHTWRSGFSLCPMYRIDTAKHDLRESRTISLIARELIASVAGASSNQPVQLSLFSPELGSETLACKVLESLNNSPLSVPIKLNPRKSRDAERDRLPIVYVAAPFTSVAEVDSTAPSPGEQQYFPVDALYHGVIPKGEYRSVLTSIASAFRRLGYSPLLPHRDINQWGYRSLTPKDVGLACMEAVQECDLFFGVLGMSFGAHVEAGLAVALGKPVILASLDTEEPTFMNRALTESGLGVEIKAKNWGHVASVIRSPDFFRIVQQAEAIAATRTIHSVWR